jgi:ethanolamine ammonia-lyase small subunit
MDQQAIDRLVQSVLRELGYAGAAPGNAGPKPAATAAAAAPAAAAPAGAPAAADVLPDLGTDEFKLWIGVAEPKSPDVLKELRRSTAARVCVGRSGPRPRTTSLLRFLADHSRSKDTVLKEISADWVARAGLAEVQSQVTDKDEYLTRPDRGRLLSQAALEFVDQQCRKSPQVQLVVSDGLSTDAVTANLDEILPPLLKGLKNANIDVGTPLFVRYGRVKIEDQIGERLGAQVVVLLIGERPGLGQSESLSCYMVYAPTKDTVEAERTCLSNIHRGGTPPVEAAAVIVDLVKEMLTRKVSGIALAKR